MFKWLFNRAPQTETERKIAREQVVIKECHKTLAKLGPDASAYARFFPERDLKSAEGRLRELMRRKAREDYEAELIASARRRPDEPAFNPNSPLDRVRRRLGW